MKSDIKKRFLNTNKHTLVSSRINIGSALEALNN
jgi:hypothetical protein